MTTTSRPRFTLPAESPSLPDSAVTPCGASSLPRDVVFPFQRVAATREGAGCAAITIGSLVSFDAGSHLVGSAERHAGPRHPLLRGLPGVVGLRGAAGAWCRLLTGMTRALASPLRASGRRRAAAGTLPASVSTESRPVAPFPFQSAGREFAFVYRCAICRVRVETSEALLESCSLCLACFYRPEAA